MHCVDKPKAPFKLVLEVATTRECSQVSLRPMDMGWRLIGVRGGDGPGSNTVNTEIRCW